MVEPKPKETHCPQGAYNPKQMTLDQLGCKRPEPRTESYTMSSGPARAKSQESEGTKTNLCINKAPRPEFLNLQMGQKKHLESHFLTSSCLAGSPTEVSGFPLNRPLNNYNKSPREF